MNTKKNEKRIPLMKHQVVLYDPGTKRWMRFDNPLRILQADSIGEVLPCLRELEKSVQTEGLYAAGFLSYEAAPAFDDALLAKSPSPFPLLWFGLYPEPEMLETIPFGNSSSYNLGELIQSIGIEDYEQTIDRIKEYIAAGDTYQVNYTIRLNTTFNGDPQALFHNLVKAQHEGYSAYVETGRYTICSASPELFFRLDGTTLTSRPMKGTAARGRNVAEDKVQADWLFNSEKNRAENIMIVDMIRNDMGRIADIGSVRVSSFFDIERYPTLFQMTSSVTSETGAAFPEILRALFPCASITGAPKARTMEIISELEPTPRRIYTGSIGFLAPDRTAQFNVAIRTMLIDTETATAEYGFGGGIVWDSDSDAEFEECQVKAQILKQDVVEFSLLETMLWTPGDGFFLRDYHLRRLESSAVYFGYDIDMDKIVKQLEHTAESLSGTEEPHKIRFLVSRDGDISCESSPLDDLNESDDVRIRLSAEPVDSQSIYLYHKTTHRKIYNAAKSSCPECDDVLLYNERGEITESCIANVFLKMNGELVTPPVDSGLLAGTYRAWMLDNGSVKEKVITVDELKNANEIYLANSVRKLRKAVFIND
ncbi:aminodeoxychorismate synthase component I [Candidatus Latescibacterota bacterium]